MKKPITGNWLKRIALSGLEEAASKYQLRAVRVRGPLGERYLYSITNRFLYRNEK